MSKIFSASLLVTGTAIGAGMLATPVSTAEGGFWPSMLIYLLCWGFSACTGLLLLEACLWLPKDSNIVSLSQHLLGRTGKFFSWILYLFFFYCLTIAYVAGGGGFINALFGDSLSLLLSILIFVLVFSPIVYIGTKAVDRVNVILMGGLAISFVFFIIIGFGKVDLDRLTQVNWPSALLALPVVLVTFSYQGIVPSLRSYFDRDTKGVRKAIIIGVSLPVFIYVVWQILILGIIPLEGANGLLAAKAKGLSSVTPLKHFVDSKLVYTVGQFFSFFALTTSFLGVTLGLFDFLTDGLNLKKKGKDRGLTYLLVYLPPTAIAILNPNIFIRALSYAGGIGGILLLGLLPILMVWSGRYRQNKGMQKQQLGGGKLVLSLLILFVIFELGVELFNELV